MTILLSNQHIHFKYKPVKFPCFLFHKTQTTLLLEPNKLHHISAIFRKQSIRALSNSIKPYFFYDQYIYIGEMQAYSAINGILQREGSTFEQFQKEMKALAIEKETYLNLFLTTIACLRGNSPQFNKYVDLLVDFKAYTGKKSADINYIGYKDRKSILLHACLHANRENIQYLISLPNLNLQSADPYGKNALFYAIANPNENNANAIANLLLDTCPSLIHNLADNNSSILFQALEMKRYSTIEVLLSRGADPNLQLKDTQNTISHQILKIYHQNKQAVIKQLLLFLKYKADFNITNKQGKNVFEAAIDVQLNLTECAERYKHIELGLVEDNDYDKESLTTLNQLTKQGDNASEIEDLESNICSQKVDFSEADFQEEENEERTKSIDELNLSGYSSDKEEDNKDSQVRLDLLSWEIQELSIACEQQHRTTWISIHPFLSALEKLANKHRLVIEVVGSFATGLWSSSSDIDINLIPMENQYINFENVLQRIYKTLKSKKSDFGIEDIYFNKNKINTIKLGLSKKYDNLIVDIAIFHRNNQNRAYVTYILESLGMYPQIKPLFFTFKKISETFGLHDHLVGGLKTYTLFLMILSIIKNLTTQNLGELFNQVALYYGFYYEYEFQCNQLDLASINCENRQEVEQFPKAIFNFRDPLNPKNNVGGKNTRVHEVQNMFKALYFALNQLQGPNYMHQLMQIHSIL